MLINQIALGLFFLYFVLMSSECSQLMNCGLQRYIKNSNVIKHVMVFFSIYIFTFILNWYTLESLVVEKFVNASEETDNKVDILLKKEVLVIKPKKDNNKYLKKSFLYSLIIYLVFVLSTKNEGKFLFAFLIGCLILVFFTIFTKTINSEIFDKMSENYIINNEKLISIIQEHPNNINDIKKIANRINLMSVSPIILGSILLYGTFQYYQRQYKEHNDNWNWLVFWLGKPKCDNL